MTHADVGSLRVIFFRGGSYWWDGGSLFGVVPKSLWHRLNPSDADNRVEAGFNSFLIDTGRNRILIETGGGDKYPQKSWERMGLSGPPQPLDEALGAAGIDPESIDIVINTHLHWDHCGWNTAHRNGKITPLFPRATYYTQRGEWEHARTQHPRDAVSYLRGNYDPLIESGRMVLLEGARDIAPGIRAIPVPGHNRDMMIVLASSGDQTFCFWSDLVPLVAHLKPTWVPAFDLFPIETIENKMVWLERAARENWLCGLGHDPKTAFIRIGKESGQFVAKDVVAG